MKVQNPSEQTKQITKKIVRFVVGASVAWTAKNVIENNTEPEKRRQEVEAKIGGAVIGAMAAEASKPWIDTKVDEAFDKWDSIVQTLNGDKPN